ncbi:MAG: tetratricopeptide repeat protein [Chloroflexota bacterium]
MRPSKPQHWIVLGGAGLSILLVAILVSASVARSGAWANPAPLPTLSPDGRLLEIDSLRGQRPTQALYHLEALAAQVGWSPDLHKLAGDIHGQLGDLQSAQFHWEQAPQDDPQTLRALSERYIEQGRWNTATTTLNALLSLQPDLPWANYHLGMILAPYDPVRAEPHLAQAVLASEFSETARAVRVTLLENRDSTVRDGVGLPVLVGLTLIDHEAWRYAELAFLYANALYEAANDAPLPEALAYASLAQNRLGKDGTQAIATAVILQPQDPQIRFLEALHYRHIGAYNTSLDIMIQAVALAPESPTLFAELGTAYRLTGELEQAEYWLRAAVGFSENDPQFQELLAQFYAQEAYNLGGDGLAALNSIMQNNPEDPELLAGMGWAFYQLGDREEGEAFIDQALVVAPSNPRALYYKARVLLGRGGNDQEAITLLETVTATDNVFTEAAQRILITLQ